MPSSPAPRYAGLDGLRAVAVLLVLAAVVVLIVIVILVQSLGSVLARAVDHRARNA